MASGPTISATAKLATLVNSVKSKSNNVFTVILKELKLVQLTIIFHVLVTNHIKERDVGRRVLADKVISLRMREHVLVVIKIILWRVFMASVIVSLVIRVGFVRSRVMS